MRICDVDGCDRKHDAHGLCHMHSRRLKVTGTLEQRKSINKGKKCSVDGCDSDAKQTGKCRMHYARFYKNGTTNRSEKRKDWRGTKVFSSDGEEQTITISVRAFCKERGLIEQNMRKVLTGDREHCGGWTFPESGFVRSTNGGGGKKVPYRACSVDGCEIDSKTKDLCEKHRQRLRKFGRIHNINRGYGEPEPDTHRCSICGEDKPMSYFHKGGFYKADGRQKYRPDCKDCVLGALKRNYEINKEAVLEKGRKWKKANRQHCLAYVRKYQEENPDKVGVWRNARNIRNVKKYAENTDGYRDKVVAQTKKRYEENREYFTEYNRKNVENLSDLYIKQSIKRISGVKNPTPELMDAKRVQLRITRYLREMVKTPANI
jgi:hypothetical protein